MHTRTSTPAFMWFDAIQATARPFQFSLSQNAPNPFNPTTTIRFSVPQGGPVSLTIWTASGQIVRTLVDGMREGGTHEVAWDGTDAAGRRVASGVYLCRLEAGSQVRVQRMLLAR